MLFYLIVIKQNVGKPLFLVHYLQSMASSDHAVLFPLNLGFFFCNSGNSLASLGEKKNHLHDVMMVCSEEKLPQKTSPVLSMQCYLSGTFA